MKNFIKASITYFILLSVLVTLLYEIGFTLNKSNCALLVKSKKNYYVYLKLFLDNFLFKKFDNFFLNEFKNCKCAAVVFLSYKDSFIFKKVYDYRLNKKEKINHETYFQIGSITKNFTAVSILKLAEQNLISLDDEIVKYIPELKINNVTIRNLLTHTSGFLNYQYLFEKIVKDKNVYLTNHDFLNYLLTLNRGLYFKKSLFNKYKYSNIGYVLLAIIVERVSGLTYKEFLKKNFFEKYSLNFLFYDDLIFNKKHDTINYAKPILEEGTEGINYFLNTIYGDKGIFSSVNELYRWDTLLFNYYLLSKPFTDTMFNEYSMIKNSNLKYGFGWRITHLKNNSVSHKIIYHTGWWRGYQAILLNIPEEKLILIVLKNKYTKKTVINVNLFLRLFYNSNNFEIENSNFCDDNSKDI